MTGPTAPIPFRPAADGIELAVRLTPKAARAGLAGVRTDDAGHAYLAVRVTAPAEGGKANNALIKLLAKTLGTAARDITLTAGAKDRRKRLRIHGDPETLQARLTAVLNQG